MTSPPWLAPRPDDASPDARQPARPLQHVMPDGHLTDRGRDHGVDSALAEQLYRDMVLARALDREAVALQRQGELSLWLQCEGQEAAQVGSARALDPRDHVFPSYREHAVGLVRGLSPTQLLAQWRGVAHSGWDPASYNYHFYSLVLGTQTLHAVGYALGCQLDNDDSICVVYFGDGAASQGDVSEAFNWASTMSLPILFICQNNQWAISTPAAKQTRTPVHQRAAGFGLRTWWVDGNDALAMHSVTTGAIETIRRGSGPALIEAETYRIGGHSTSDDPSRYRPTIEVDTWRGRDPITRLEVVLRDLGVGASWFEEVNRAGQEFARRTRQECKEIDNPHLIELFDEVYAHPHPTIALEQQEHRRFEQLTAAVT